MVSLKAISESYFKISTNPQTNQIIDLLKVILEENRSKFLHQVINIYHFHWSSTSSFNCNLLFCLLLFFLFFILWLLHIHCIFQCLNISGSRITKTTLMILSWVRSLMSELRLFLYVWNCDQSLVNIKMLNKRGWNITLYQNISATNWLFLSKDIDLLLVENSLSDKSQQMALS